MAKHTFSEILAHFKSHMHTNLESAQQAVYDLGHAAGREEAKAEFAAGVGDTAPATPAAGAPIDDSEKDASQGQQSEEGPHPEGQGTPGEATQTAEHAAA